jgi:molybdate transport system substrate-binding protein
MRRPPLRACAAERPRSPALAARREAVRRKVALACAFALAGAGAAAGAAAAVAVPVVAAASDLKFALEEVAQRFRADTGHELKLVFGSSGNLHRQIVQGAPFELFLCADEELVFRLADAGLAPDRGALYARGRLVLFAPKGSTIRPDQGLGALRAAAADGRLQRLAIANPEHAPYGRAAEQALRAAGAWEAVRGKLVLGENVSQAAQFATSGAAQAGVIAYSLALAPQVAKLGSYALVPESMHAPLNQRMVLTRAAGPVAREFYRHLQQPAARALLERYGFALPAGGAR